ncbi:YopX family protein [Streptococcus suis]|uniref:YopX family protein n=1 Tax=Streptococcus suis TaxID=1307 RepID=UPI0038BB228A
MLRFRAWNIFRNKWVKHFYITENGLIYNMEQLHRDLIGAVPIEQSGLILMQSTGLVDKRGNDIWEGDVVEFEDADDIENVYINQGVIEWCQGGFTVSNRTTVTLDDLLDGDKLEVTIIGNIWEGSDLIDLNNPATD